MIKIAFYDTKEYDIPSFIEYGKQRGIEFKFYDNKLNEDTVTLAQGFDGVCVFVNDKKWQQSYASTCFSGWRFSCVKDRLS